MPILSCPGGGRASGVSPRYPDSWRDQAACQYVDPEVFFPDGETGPTVRDQVAQAKAVCLACPVLSECREFELTPTESGRLRNERFGVFAAMTPDERRRALRERRGVAAAVATTDAAAASVAGATAGSEVAA